MSRYRGPNHGEVATQLLRKLVAARSPNPPGDERAVVDVVIDEATNLGLPEAEVWSSVPERPNLIFRIGDDRPCLMLAGHLDTMPPGDGAAWDSDPFALTNVSDHLVGLGSADMKGAVAALLVASARIAARPALPGSLVVVLAADEEAGSAFGMQWLAANGLLAADAAVLLEPSSLSTTSWDRLYVAQRGHCLCWLVAEGVPGHSGVPLPIGTRATVPFARALTALVEEQSFVEWKHPIDGTPPMLNVGTVLEGGVVPFAYPEFQRAGLDVRTIEGMTQQIVVAELTRIVAAAVPDGRAWIELAEGPLAWFAPGVSAANTPIAHAAAAAWRATLGFDPGLGVLPGATDASVLNGLGIPAIPAFGPGSLNVAHRPNEWIRADDLATAIDLFESLIDHYWMQADLSDRKAGG
ncbi:MAG: hypothetical protein DCC49_10690 [Acidobacteria bacterium]|nr:MAG: hypothetical protein DCC49_10690 [Acidobacteriota bacterium]